MTMQSSTLRHAAQAAAGGRGRGMGSRAWARARDRWLGWSLARQFATCATLVMLPAMLVMGLWVSDRIQESVTRGAGTSAALYIENFVEPLLQDLANGQQLSDESRDRIGRLLTDTSLGQRVLTFKIWESGGRVIASSRAGLVGQRLPPSAGLREAWTGAVTAGFDHLKDVENAAEKQTGIPLLELYIPIRARGSDRVLAVAEFYEKAPELKAELIRARAMSWMVVALVTLGMLGALFAIVRRGSRTIDQQRAALEKRVGELTALLAENRLLRQRAHRASALASENNEAYLRRLGADLHDGPGQLISLALLRLDRVEAAAEPRSEERRSVRDVLTDALKDIRNILSGLVLPEIDALSTLETIDMVVTRHEHLTGTQVAVDCGDLPRQVGAPLKQCLYRIIQEGLSNAFRHGGGKGQSVAIGASGGVVTVVVRDRGPGLGANGPQEDRRLGVKGLANRVESLGGELSIEADPRGGTRLTARLPLEAGDLIDA